MVTSNSEVHLRTKKEHTKEAVYLDSDLMLSSFGLYSKPCWSGRICPETKQAMTDIGVVISAKCGVDPVGGKARTASLGRS